MQIQLKWLKARLHFLCNKGNFCPENVSDSLWPDMLAVGCCNFSGCF